MEKDSKKFDGRLLLVTTLIISICSIIYELLISSISSYLIGDSITQFSITIGLYMSAMGIGSYLSKHIRKQLFNKFVLVELGVGTIGGLSSFVLFMSNIYMEKVYMLVMYVIIILIGILVGIEIPLLTRIIEEQNSNIRINLANIFTFDYIGGLIGSIAFPLVLLPKIGFVSTAFLIGTINMGIATIIIWKYKSFIIKNKVFRNTGWVLLLLGIIMTLFSNVITKQIESGLYRDDIIYSAQTPYQKIVMTKHKDDLRLFLNGNIQFSSEDEYRYHEALIHIPFLYVNEPKRVLVLGGGDGLAVREILKYQSVEEITLVDIDHEMTELCRKNKQIVELNKNSLNNEKVKILNEDAYVYVANNQSEYDVIVVDLPDPNNEALNKLYTDIFYNYLKANLTKTGVAVIQSTSPYYAKKSFWCINKTLATQFETVLPYHVQVPAFGEWGFNIAYNGKLERKTLEVDTKFLSNEDIDSLFLFPKDEIINLEEIEINDLFKPSLIQYYNKDVENW